MPPPDPQRGRPLAAFAGTPRPGRAPRRAAGGRRLAGRRPYPHAGCANPAPAPQARPHRPHRDRVQGRLPPGGLTKQKRKNRRPLPFPRQRTPVFKTCLSPRRNRRWTSRKIATRIPPRPLCRGRFHIGPPRAAATPTGGYRIRPCDRPQGPHPCRGRCSHRPRGPGRAANLPPGENRNLPRARGCASHAALARSRARTRAGYPGRPA